MIESRYSIEYIDPNTEKPSAKLGRFLIFSTLTIAILATIATLVFTNLPDNTSQVVTNKIQQFISFFNQPSISLPIKEPTAISEAKKLSILNKEKAQKDAELAQQLLAAKLKDQYKKEVERLSQENTIQHNEAVKQLTANQTLTKKLDAISNQLKNTIQESDLLKKEVASLHTKNKTISALLIKTEETTKDYADKIKKLNAKKIVNQPVIIKSVVSKPVEEKPELKSVKVKIVTIIKNTEDESTGNKNKKYTSQVDAIIAAMETKNSPLDTQKTELNDSTK